MASPKATTESMLMEQAVEVTDALTRLDGLGVRLAIDDFGTGYSSLTYLKRFPVRCIKIDQSFIGNIPADPDDVAIVRAIVAMARSLEITVTAEGVETREQLELLQELECDTYQGYLFSRPRAGGGFRGAGAGGGRREEGGGRRGERPSGGDGGGRRKGRLEAARVSKQRGCSTLRAD